jgi:alkanesulfonate monooxygenase SsuD/methylene tetrahydromethanopterin reductase-like flavin-dependent oxidoreductase (luciferase family)
VEPPSDDDAQNRELFEECVAIIKTAWERDTFSFRGKYWSFPPEGQRSRTSTRST